MYKGFTRHSKEVKECEKRCYGGEIILKDCDEYPRYGIFFNKMACLKFCDVEELLMKFYKNENVVYIMIKMNGKTIFTNVGKLFKKINFGAYEWFVGDDKTFTGECLGDVFFRNVGKKITMEIGVVE